MGCAKRLLLAAVCGLAACAGGGGGSGGGLGAPAGVQAVAGDGLVVLSWTAPQGSTSSEVYWSTSSGVTPANGARIAAVSSPYQHGGLQNGLTYHYVVVALDGVSASPPSAEVSATPVQVVPSTYDPPWSAPGAGQTLAHVYDPGLTSAQNGNLLAIAIQALLPGQRLVVGGGTYDLVTPLWIDLQGTAAAPIEIVAAAGETPALVQADPFADVLRIGGQGAQAATRYLLIRGFELSGGDVGVRLEKCSEVWLDQVEIHGTGASTGTGINATTESVDHLYVTRSHVHHTNGFGEGLRLGNGGSRVVRDSVIALNHVHDTPRDGILLLRGCHSNLLAENRIHDTGFPCIRFFGTAGSPVNLIERNVLFDSGDNVLQAEEGEALVRNNLLVGPAGNKLFDSSHNAGTLRDLSVVHNTILGNGGYGVGLFAWDAQPGLVFANNAVYVKTSGASQYALSTTPGNAGGTLSGNVVLGSVKNYTGGTVPGATLADFQNVPAWSSWPYAPVDLDDLIPSAGAALVGAGDPTYLEALDITGAARALPLDAGCRDAP